MIKTKKIQIGLLALTLTSLILLVGIQINWMLRSARMQERQFSHAVALAMDRITETLANNEEICQEISACLHGEDSRSCAMMLRNRLVFAGIDTLIRHELQHYNIDLDFEFDIYDKGALVSCPLTRQISVSDNLEQSLAEAGYELRIRFPDKVDFIKAQMGYVFISSIALLVLVYVSFLLIYRYYKRERRLAGNIIDFVNNMTHEFKTPLTNISLANSMLAKSSSVGADAKLSTYANVISSEHRRLKERVDILLKAALLENEQALAVDRFDAFAEVSHVADTYALQLLERDGGLSVDRSGDCFTVAGNVDMFRISIGNLIDNAIRHHTGSPRVAIMLRSSGNTLRIDVADNGPGIPRKYLSQVFDKYFRVPTGNVHNNEGFGLGLFFVKNTIEKMNGRVYAESTAGRGTVFTIKLPLECS